MNLAAIIISPWVTVPVGTLLAIGLLCYWVMLGADDVPPSRRVIRRASTGAMLFLLPLAVAGLSLLQPREQPRSFVLVWSIILLGVLCVLLLALFDLRNNLRLHTQEQREIIKRAAVEEAARRARRRESGSEDDPDDQAASTT